jgi:hypothetical protein
MERLFHSLPKSLRQDFLHTSSSVTIILAGTWRTVWRSPPLQFRLDLARQVSHLLDGSLKPPRGDTEPFAPVFEFILDVDPTGILRYGSRVLVRQFHQSSRPNRLFFLLFVFFVLPFAFFLFFFLLLILFVVIGREWGVTA